MKISNYMTDEDFHHNPCVFMTDTFSRSLGKRNECERMNFANVFRAKPFGVELVGIVSPELLRRMEEQRLIQE